MAPTLAVPGLFRKRRECEQVFVQFVELNQYLGNSSNVVLRILPFFLFNLTYKNVFMARFFSALRLFRNFINVSKWSLFIFLCFAAIWILRKLKTPLYLFWHCEIFQNDHFLKIGFSLDISSYMLFNNPICSNFFLYHLCSLHF